MEQLNLAFKPKQQRRYFIALLVMSYIIYSTSRKRYPRLLEEQVLFFPFSIFENVVSDECF